MILQSLLYLLLLLNPSVSASNVFMNDDFDYLDPISPSTIQVVLPTGSTSATMDSNGLSRPILTEGPRDSYLVRNQPAILKCRALNSDLIRFKCNGHWSNDEHQTEVRGRDPVSTLAYIETSLIVHRKEVESYTGFDGFRCHCFVSSLDASQAVRSDGALLRLSYLRKHFYDTPTNDRLPEGTTIRMPCVPPDGDPTPNILWLKNGHEIQSRVDPNVILANDGSLIISSARMSDSGNYSCEARNIVNRRISDTARIIVYVDGSWSPWSAWTGLCPPMDCAEVNRRQRKIQLLPRRNRIRLCTDPAPGNGGEHCSGSDMEHRSCPTDCPVDGHWTVWSDWSKCSLECHRFRTRECARPAPTNGGRQCQGRFLQTKNCSHGYCKKGIARSSEADHSSVPSGLALYTGLICTFLLFILVVLMIFWLFCRRRRSNGNVEKEKDIYYPEIAGHLRTVLVQQSDMTRTVMIGSPKQNKGSFSARSVRSSGSGYSSGRTGSVQNGTLISSRAALIAESSSSSNSCSSTKVPDSDENYATLYEFGAAEEEEHRHPVRNIRHSTIPSLFPADSLSLACLDHTGGRISIPKCSVSLSVAEGTIRTPEEMFVAIETHSSDGPKLAEGETVLSPVICAGPMDVHWEKPVIVSFMHCASLFPKDNWQITLLVNHELPGQSTTWERAVRLGEETLNTMHYCQLDLDSCHVLTDRPCRLVLVGRSKLYRTATKRTKLAVFAPSCPSACDYCLRVYCINDDNSALQSVLSEERQLGGYPIIEPHSLSLSLKDGDLCCRLEDVSSDWRIKPTSGHQEIPIGRLWSSLTALHCSFSLESANNSTDVLNLTAGIIVYQKGRSIKTVLRITSRNNPSIASFECDNAHEWTRLPMRIKRQICNRLDPPIEGENDWRMLARTLGLDRYLPYFATRRSPTEHILDLWEAREYDSPAAFVQLSHTLRSMGRLDVVVLLDPFVQQQQREIDHA